MIELENVKEFLLECIEAQYGRLETVESYHRKERDKAAREVRCFKTMPSLKCSQMAEAEFVKQMEEFHLMLLRSKTKQQKLSKLRQVKLTLEPGLANFISTMTDANEPYIPDFVPVRLSGKEWRRKMLEHWERQLIWQSDAWIDHVKRVATKRQLILKAQEEVERACSEAEKRPTES